MLLTGGVVMARNKMIQVSCEPLIYEKVKQYRNVNKLSSDASAMRQLALIGLSSLDREPVKGMPTDRDLLESILFHVTKNKRSLGALELELD